MSTNLAYQFNLGRNGTSQAERLLEALKKDFVEVDERSIPDLLRFAQAFAEELNYVNSQNEIEGNWTGFLGTGFDLVETMDAYLKKPREFLADENQLAFLSRPHLVLFLTFLQLLKDFPQQALNEFTGRHLAHYYVDILRFTPKEAEADHVHVMVELAKGFKDEKLFVPENTPLNAGKDTEGNPLVYKTTADLMVNRSQVTELKSVFVNKKVDRLASFDFSRDFMNMMSLALGENMEGKLEPGGDLPPANFLGSNVMPTEEFLKKEVSVLLRFVTRRLFMTFADFRKMIRLYQNRFYDRNEWAVINTELGNIAVALSNPAPAFTNEKDFILNFSDASGSNPLDNTFFSTLQSVNNVYELYDELELVLQILAQSQVSNRVFYENRRDDLLGFIHEFYYDDPGNISNNATISRFRNMMAMRLHVIDDWRELLELVEQKSGKNNLSFNLEYPDFDQLLRDAYQENNLATFFNQAHNTIATAEAYYNEMIAIEHYFGLHAEEVAQLLKGFSVVEMLGKAHTQKNSHKRIIELQTIHSGSGFNVLVQEALGRPEPGDLLPAIPQAHPTLQAFYAGEVAGVDDENLTSQVREYIEQTLAFNLDHFRFMMDVQGDETSIPDFQAPPWQWDRIFLLLEKAERKIRGIKLLPSPEQSHLLGVHATPDAPSILASEVEESYSRWETFGSQAMDYARLGLMLGSPLLNLEGGDRKITLDLVIDPDSMTSDEESELTDLLSLPENWPFSLWLTGEEDWSEVPYEVTFPIQLANNTVLRFEVSLAVDADPVRPLPADHEDQLGNQPVLRILLEEPTAYKIFSSLKFMDCTLGIEVENLQPSLLRNDQLILKVGEPFEPFGSHPRSGSKFYFTHPEIASKKLDEVGIDFEWMGIGGATFFADTYLNYDVSGGDRKVSSSFTAHFRMNDQGFIRRFTEGGTREKNVSLIPFDKTNYTLPLDQAYTPSGSKPLPDYDWQEDAALGDKVFDSDRYFYLELGNLDFGHDEYPRLAKEKANLLAIDIARSSKNNYTEADYEVNPPYTPQVQGFSIHYKASESGVGLELFEGKTKLFHLHPFGFREVATNGDFIMARYGNEGELYLGLEGVKPPVDVSFLFQMAEGSADPDLKAPIVLWDYLQGDEWKRLEEKGKILGDTTHGLLNSGIIRLRIPAEADTSHNLLPTGKHWIRVSAPENSQALSDTIAIHSQAVLATLEKEGVAASHFDQPLAPETISQLAKRNTSIKGILQPYASFGGRPAEPAENLHVRVSERLRHKNRALTAWDYERLVLEKFPQVYRAKCLPGGGGVVSELGKVDMIVVPDIKGLKLFDPFEPKLPFNVLEEISQFLEMLAPPAAKIVIRNPVYIQLRIRMSVELFPAYQADTQYYLGQLHEGLLRLLAPWAYDEGGELVLSGKFYPSLVIDFVEQQPYIDYVKDFRLLYGEEGAHRLASELQLQSGLQAPRPDGIWVSARDHLLDAGGTVGRGVGYMKVEVDLVVG